MAKSMFNGTGYFFNDNRAAGGTLEEDDTLKCSHCPQGLLKTQWKLKGGMCFVCQQPLCEPCTARALKFGCEGPEVKRLERAVNEDYRRRQNAKVLGL